MEYVNKNRHGDLTQAMFEERRDAAIRKIFQYNEIKASQRTPQRLFDHVFLKGMASAIDRFICVGQTYDLLYRHELQCLLGMSWETYRASISELFCQLKLTKTGISEHPSQFVRAQWQYFCSLPTRNITEAKRTFRKILVAAEYVEPMYQRYQESKKRIRKLEQELVEAKRARVS